MKAIIWKDKTITYKNTKGKIVTKKLDQMKSKRLSVNELWELMREDWNKWQFKAHEDDRMSLMDYAQEYVGTTFNGAQVFLNDHYEVSFRYIN
jgi:hypothetical protein